ncbi:hypothetical protein [Clostridium butyricum]
MASSKLPPSKSLKLFGFIPLRIICLSLIIFLEFSITTIASDKIHSNIGQLVLLIILGYMIYKTIIYYNGFRRLRKPWKNSNVESALQYLIHSLKLYDEEIIDNGVNREKNS